MPSHRISMCIVHRIARLLQRSTMPSNTKFLRLHSRHHPSSVEVGNLSGRLEAHSSHLVPLGWGLKLNRCLGAPVSPASCREPKPPPICQPPDKNARCLDGDQLHSARNPSFSRRSVVTLMCVCMDKIPEPLFRDTGTAREEIMEVCFRRNLGGIRESGQGSFTAAGPVGKLLENAKMSKSHHLQC